MRFIYLLILLITFSYSNSCIKCHNGIEHIRDPKSKMMQNILDVAERAGVKGNGCLCVTVEIQMKITRPKHIVEL